MHLGPPFTDSVQRLSDKAGGVLSHSDLTGSWYCGNQKPANKLSPPGAPTTSFTPGESCSDVKVFPDLTQICGPGKYIVQGCSRAKTGNKTPLCDSQLLIQTFSSDILNRRKKSATSPPGRVVNPLLDPEPGQCFGKNRETSCNWSPA